MVSNWLGFIPLFKAFLNPVHGMQLKINKYFLQVVHA